VLALTNELKRLGLVQKEAIKFAKVAVDDYGAGSLRAAIAMKDFDAAITEAKLLPVSVDILRGEKAKVTVPKHSI